MSISTQEKSIENLIYIIRGKQVMLDFDLANLYGYTVKSLNQQVKRNIERFPDDFMFQITKEELKLVKSQNVTSPIEGYFKGQEGGVRKLPYAFTEQGIYMISTVLKSELAISQSIQIMRMFKEMHHYLIENQAIVSPLDFKRLSNLVQKNSDELETLKSDVVKIADNFISDVPIKEIVILNNQKFTAKEAYYKIVSEAKEKIIMIDDYVSVNTLSIFKVKSPHVQVILFTDNKGHGANKLTQKDIDDFNHEFGLLTVKKNGICHDRFIIPDFDTPDEKVYLSGASSKDAGNKLSAIVLLNDANLIHDVVERLLNGE